MKSSISGQTCVENQDCGESPKAAEMTGDDVEVICGEWEIGIAPMSSSGESYNIIFTVEVCEPSLQSMHFIHSLGNQKTPRLWNQQRKQ